MLYKDLEKNQASPVPCSVRCLFVCVCVFFCGGGARVKAAAAAVGVGNYWLTFVGGTAVAVAALPWSLCSGCMGFFCVSCPCLSVSACLSEVGLSLSLYLRPPLSLSFSPSFFF